MCVSRQPRVHFHFLHVVFDVHMFCRRVLYLSTLRSSSSVVARPQWNALHTINSSTTNVTNTRVKIKRTISTLFGVN